MAHTAETALKAAVFFTDSVTYSVIHLAPNGLLASAGIVAQIGTPFAALIVDHHEVTLVIEAEAISEFAARLRDHRVSEQAWRLITFDVVLDYPVFGFMARIATALAHAGISIMPYAAFERDHILVPEAQLDLALATLRDLQASLP